MNAIVKDGAITATASTVQKLFPNTSFPSAANTEFLNENNVKDVVEGIQKDRTYYFVAPGNLELVDGIPTQKYTNTAKAIEDSTTDGITTPGLKTNMTNRVKNNAGQLLSHTDWMVIRKYERDVAIPSATATYRAAVILSLIHI